MNEDGKKDDVTKHGGWVVVLERIIASPTFAFTVCGSCAVTAAFVASAGHVDSGWFVFPAIVAVASAIFGVVGELNISNARHAAIDYLTRLLPEEAQLLFGVVLDNNRSFNAKVSLATDSLVRQGVITEIASNGTQGVFEVPPHVWDCIKDDGDRLCMVAAKNNPEEAYYLREAFTRDS